MLKVDSVVVGIPSVTNEEELQLLATNIAKAMYGKADFNTLYYFYDTDEESYCISLKYVPLVIGCREELKRVLDELLADMIYSYSHVSDVWIIAQRAVNLEVHE